MSGSVPPLSWLRPQEQQRRTCSAVVSKSLGTTRWRWGAWSTAARPLGSDAVNLIRYQCSSLLASRSIDPNMAEDSARISSETPYSAPSAARANSAQEQSSWTRSMNTRRPSTAITDSSHSLVNVFIGEFQTWSARSRSEARRLAHLLAHYVGNPPGTSHTNWTSSQTIEQVSDSRRTIWMLYLGLLIRRFWVQVPGGALYVTR